MNPSASASRAERLFPFVMRARKLLVGREALARSKSQLQWVLISTDISESSRNQALKDFAAYPVVQHFVSADFEKFFGVRNAKVLGFAKSTLAKSIYAELKASRINKPLTPAPAVPMAARPSTDEPAG